MIHLRLTSTLLRATLIISLLHIGISSSSAQETQAPAPKPKVIRISPSGNDIQNVRQIDFQFDRAVAPIGRMERKEDEVPVSFQPSVACEWRWLNTTTLSCQLGEKTKLKPATAYTLQIRPTAKDGEQQIIQKGLTEFLTPANGGMSTAAAPTFKFITERARVTNYTFQLWGGPSSPRIYVSFNVQVTQASALSHLYFKGDKDERIPVSLLPLKEKEELPQTSTYWIVEPQKAIGDDVTSTLNVEPGITASEGTEGGVENRVVVQFDTFPQFSYLGVKCCVHKNPTQDYRCNGGEDLFIPRDTASSDLSRCDPLAPSDLVFSVPFFQKKARKALVTVPSLKAGLEAQNREEMGEGEEEGDAEAEDSSEEEYPTYQYEPHKRGKQYEMNLPYGLKAFSQYEIKAAGTDIRDVFDRPLSTDLATTILTDHRQSRFVMDKHFTVLEKDENTHLPIAVQNLDNVKVSFDSLTASGGQSNQEKTIEVDKPTDLSYYFPLKIRDLLSGASGIIKGRFDPNPLPPLFSSDDDSVFVSEVTPFNVHVKLGHFNTLVWVTKLSDGSPVSNATVGIYKESMRELSPNSTNLSEATTDKDGVAVLGGTNALDPKLEVQTYWSNRGQDHEVFKVKVVKKGDFALIPLIYDLQVYPRSTQNEYFSTERKPVHGHLHAWGTTPQGIYKLGQTIQYKLYVRDQDVNGLISAPTEGYSLKVTDPMDKIVHEVSSLSLNEFGGFSGEFQVPESGAVGLYKFTLKASFAPKHTYSSSSSDQFQTWEPLTVLVSDFTPSPFHVTADLNGKLFKVGDQVRVSTDAKLHAGGPYGKAPKRITARLVPASIQNLPPQLEPFTFQTNTDENATEITVYSNEDVLNDQGHGENTFIMESSNIIYGSLNVEASVQDDRGKNIATESSAHYAGVDRFAGVKLTDWFARVGKPEPIQLAVVNELGQPVPDSKISVKYTYALRKASKVKGAGNAYLTHYETEIVDAGTCEATSKIKPVLCNLKPDKPGTYYIEATVTDTKGRTHTTKVSTFAVGSGAYVWESNDDNSLEITPEKKSYKVGEKARFLVKNPYQKAKALVTIERYGVLKHSVKTLTKNAEIIEVPVTADLIPGFYLSVTLESPRVAKPQDDGAVDLGKPSMKMGYAAIDVKDAAKELNVTAKADRETYKPREKVNVNLTASTKQGDNPPIEFAVAVLDESVFDLLTSGMTYFDPYKGLYGLEPLDLMNFDLLLDLIGRRKWEKKGANSGGDGGSLATRTQFKFVSYWNPSLKADRVGKAQFSFDTPDNLTGWKILAVAVTPQDRMGVGTKSIKVNKPTEIRPALPNQVIEGDSFEADFTVMNRTDKPRTLNVTMNATGPIETIAPKVESIIANPYDRTIVRLPLKAVKDGKITITVRAGDATDSDGIELPLTVNKRSALETSATYGTTDSDKADEKYSLPQNMRGDVGDIKVVLSPSVISSIEGAFSYMKRYPYLCWEQILTKGVMASHYQNLKSYVGGGFTWDESEKLPQQTLNEASNFQAPNGGMSYFVPRDEYVDPYLSAYTAIAFNWFAKSGHAIPTSVESKLHDYLLNLLRHEAFPTFYSLGMSSTVRAVALAALAEDGKVTLEDVLRYKSALPQMSLFGKAHYLIALTHFENVELEEKAVLDMIYAQGNETGGKFMFQEAIDTVYFSRILTTPLRDNCAVLSAFMAFNKAPGDPLKKPKYGEDVPFKLVRMISQTRKSRDHWENTQENLFCMSALVDYSKIYESTPPKGTWTVAFDKEKMGEALFGDVKDAPQTISRELRESDPGKDVSLEISRNGVGRIYYSAQLNYSPKELKTDPINSGIEVHREYSVERAGHFTLLKSPFDLTQGEIVRVDLYVSVPAARNFVVVDDPIPGGLEPVNRDLATTSKVDADKAKIEYAGGSYWYRFVDGWFDFADQRWGFYHKELRHDSARFYSDYIAPGNYHLSYTAQVIAPGEFTVLPTHAEEMYDPDVFGQTVPETLKVQPEKR